MQRTYTNPTIEHTIKDIDRNRTLDKWSVTDWTPQDYLEDIYNQIKDDPKCSELRIHSADDHNVILRYRHSDHDYRMLEADIVDYMRHSV